MFEERLKNFYSLLDQAKLPAVAINPSPTLSYLTGLHFSRDERPKILLIGRNIQATLILPALEEGQLEYTEMDIVPFTYGENPDGWSAVFKQALESTGLKGNKIGIDPLQLRVLELDLLEHAAPGIKFTSAAAVIDSARLQKDETEIQKMKKAVQIAQKAFKAVLPSIKIGITERDIASELVLQLLQHGSDPNIPFSPIVASGPNAANPHAKPSKRHLSPGDLVVIDWGARFEGYCSDITRTLAIGGISVEFAEIAEIVSEANKAGRHAARSGVSIGSVDRAAREVIENAGYGEYFIHRTGHGLGLEVHEAPNVIEENALILKEGITFTVEPGIYIPGKIGVRIEDNVVVRNHGGESLTDIPRHLIKIY